ncbi:BURP domain-containing protein 3-like [Musa acuminata AAA Group]|uniref:BURP domain-containing protein 3-like n=1 Tax=Musa acuminata AAA Group TaxID=214697 RepID=UPI0031CF55F6
MDRFLSLLSMFLLAAVSHAALSPQIVYWHSVLPNTPMPSAISDFIDPDVLAEEKSGVNVYTKGKSGGTTVNVGHGRVYVPTGNKNYAATGNKNYAATETQIHNDPNVALFFLEKELRPGAKMNLHFTKTTSGGASFLTQKEADAIPFSSAKLPEILDHFSVKPGSAEAEAMKTTLQECEEPAVRGERKYCATSLESMVEFSMSSLGTRDVTAMSTTVAKVVTPRQQYTVTGVKALAGDRLVACHPEAYAYPVFYCHATGTGKAYRVGLVGTADGVAVEAVAVCHTDTSAWNPNHVAFKVLKVKPGSVPVCHFLPDDSVVWSRSG